MTELPPLPDDIVQQCNAGRGGFNDAIGIEFVRVSYDEIVAEIEISPTLHQPYGIVHGGVYSSIVETLASTGAALNVRPLGFHAVGLENNTSFLRAVREGRLRAVATPLTRGRRSQVWSVTITSDDGRTAAVGRVRMLCLEMGAEVAGQSVGLSTSRE